MKRDLTEIVFLCELEVQAVNGFYHLPFYLQLFFHKEFVSCVLSRFHEIFPNTTDSCFRFKFQIRCLITIAWPESKIFLGNNQQLQEVPEKLCLFSKSTTTGATPSCTLFVSWQGERQNTENFWNARMYFANQYLL